MSDYHRRNRGWAVEVRPDLRDSFLELSSLRFNFETNSMKQVYAGSSHTIQYKNILELYNVQYCYHHEVRSHMSNANQQPHYRRKQFA